MTIDFTATRRALKVLDAAVAARIDSFGAALTEAQVEQLLDADRWALVGVQEAFHADTKGINDRGPYAQADIDYMRKCAGAR